METLKIITFKNIAKMPNVYPSYMQTNGENKISLAFEIYVNHIKRYHAIQREAE